MQMASLMLRKSKGFLKKEDTVKEMSPVNWFPNI